MQDSRAARWKDSMFNWMSYGVVSSMGALHCVPAVECKSHATRQQLISITTELAFKADTRRQEIFNMTADASTTKTMQRQISLITAPVE
jgi:hypothetical protein